MAENPAPAPPKRKRGVGRTREWITSAVLITFTAAIGIACVIILSSTLTQTRMAAIVVDGVTLNIWRLDDIRQQWGRIRDEIGKLSDAISEAEETRSKHTGEVAQAEQEFRAKRTALITQLSEFLYRVRVLDADLAKDMDKKEPPEQYAQLGVARERLLKDHADLKTVYDRTDLVYAEYAKARGRRADAQAKSQAIIEEIKGRQDAIAGSRTSLETLFAQINPKVDKLDDGSRARVENALYELHSGRGLLGIFINRLVTTQPDILTLTLVIFMGVLGSSLQMTYAFFKQHKIERLGAYLLRICVGAITALVIFIVAKAGVPVIADASKLGGDAAINPYFVSFLAIISGLMSENAIASVQNQGARFFGADPTSEPKRWARQDLRETFKASGRDPDRVKRLLQASDEEFEGWVSGKEPMPANVQMIVAGVLQVPPRDLYTDIPPDQAGTTS